MAAWEGALEAALTGRPYVGGFTPSAEDAAAYDAAVAGGLLHRLGAGGDGGSGGGGGLDGGGGVGGRGLWGGVSAADSGAAVVAAVWAAAHPSLERWARHVGALLPGERQRWPLSEAQQRMVSAGGVRAQDAARRVLCVPGGVCAPGGGDGASYTSGE